MRENHSCCKMRHFRLFSNTLCYIHYIFVIKTNGYVFLVGPPNMKHVNGVPGSGSTTATSVSLGHYKGDQYRRTAMYHHSNGNGLNGHGITESSNMLISMAAPGNSGNERRPADGRGYNKSFWHNLQLHHFWLPL